MGPTPSASLTISDQVLTTFAAEIGPSQPSPGSDVDQLSPLCRDDDPIVVVGSKTRWNAGGEVDNAAREVRAPSGVVTYDPEEMTVTVRAGTTVAALSAVLAEAGQRCALPDRGGTVGGAVAVGENDLLCLGKGRLRASVLQVRYVSADGVLVTGGGPTVKNVTGFDLPRLMTGALGTLGALAEVILRTNPIPLRSVWFHAAGVDPFAVYDSLLSPSAVLWDGEQTWVLVEGHETDVEAESSVLTRLGSFTPTVGPPELPSHRWSLPPGQLRHLGQSLDLEQTSAAYVASVGVGTVFATVAQPHSTVDPVVAALSARMKHQFDPTGRLNPGRWPGD